MTTEYCMWAGTCACGVHVRAGKDVFVIDHCDGLHFTNFTHTSGNGHLYVTRYYGNFYVVSVLQLANILRLQPIKVRIFSHS